MVKALLDKRSLYLLFRPAQAAVKGIEKLDEYCGLLLSGIYLTTLIIYAIAITIFCHVVAVTVERRFMPLFVVSGLFGFAVFFCYA